MIKVKIQNPTKGRNEPTFRPFFFIKDMLKNYSIDITDSDDYDFLFVGMNDFINKKISLNDSINWGLENLSKITGDYFLFDGSDSTSLMGAYEVFEQSDAIYLFKNQKLKNREDYKKPTAFNKWFFGEGSDLDLGYDISVEQWNRIKLSGFNLGYLLPQYKNTQQIKQDKQNDICAIFQAEHKYNEDHGVRNDLLYTEHRKELWTKLQPLKSKYKMLTDKLPYETYIRNLWDSKISLSPFGMGELCFRDFESMQFGTIILKPNQDAVNTIPNIFIDGETYIGCKHDWSDIEEKIEYVMSNFNELNQELNNNIRKKFLGAYTYENLCMYWYEMFSRLEEKITNG